ncbi:Exonuclease mut-7 homolog [Linum grandiflorum]
MEPINRLPPTHIVASNDSPEFARLTQVLARSSIVGLDAEWKPSGTQQSTFPNVSLLQLACQLTPASADDSESEVFLLDLDSIPLPSIWELLKEVFVSPDILKLGFRFKQDLAYLSSTFCSHGCDPGFDKVEPYLDITSLYHYLQPKLPGVKLPNETKSLATICKEILDISLSKELQCSDWSCRPLTEEQKTYAAADAHCLLQIFSTFQSKVVEKGSTSQVANGHIPYVGLKEVLQLDERGNKHMRVKTCEALAIVRATVSSVHCQIIMGDGVISRTTLINTMPMAESLLTIVKKHGEKILLKASDRKPRSSKKRGKRKPSTTQVTREDWIDDGSWEGSTPWDLSEGGDGSPKFLCDVMLLHVDRRLGETSSLCGNRCCNSIL